MSVLGGDGAPVGLLYPVGDGDRKKLSPWWGMGMGMGEFSLYGDGEEKAVPERGQTRCHSYTR